MIACGYGMRANVRAHGRPGAPRLVAWVLCAMAGYMAWQLSGVAEGVARVVLGPVLGLVMLHLAFRGSRSAPATPGQPPGRVSPTNCVSGCCRGWGWPTTPVTRSPAPATARCNAPPGWRWRGGSRRPLDAVWCVRCVPPASPTTLRRGTACSPNSLSAVTPTGWPRSHSSRRGSRPPHPPPRRVLAAVPPRYRPPEPRQYCPPTHAREGQYRHPHRTGTSSSSPASTEAGAELSTGAVSRVPGVRYWPATPCPVPTPVPNPSTAGQWDPELWRRAVSATTSTGRRTVPMRA